MYGLVASREESETVEAESACTEHHKLDNETQIC